MQEFRRIVAMFMLLALLQPVAVAAQGEDAAGAGAGASDQVQDTLATLQSLYALQKSMRADIDKLQKQLEAAQGDVEKQDLRQQIDKLRTDLQGTTRNLGEIAAGADIDALRVTAEKPFNLQEELFALIRPVMKEMKEMTSRVREKSDLKDRIAYFSAKLPVAERAVAHINSLLDSARDDALKKVLKGVLADWEKQLTYLRGELQSAQLQLTKLEESEASLASASRSYLKEFFQQRGLYLAQALLVVIVIVLLSRLSYRAMYRLIPGYRAEHRSFRLRLVELVHRLVTLVLVILGPMVVFYVVEDWVLFSLGILLMIGFGLTLRHALPRYWQQVQLFLNVGAVREGERVYLDGLPWLVKSINIFSILDNPAAEVCQRVRIDSLVDLKSHPFRREDPWFPCMRGDWVLLSDGMRGKVLGITVELVQLIMRGGAVRTYNTADFLGLSPINLSRNFRLKETIGISYDLQAGSVKAIPDLLRTHVETRADEEGYGRHLLNLRVEFERANTSSLDIVVIADFDGELGELYGRLGRAMQRWCVEACTKHGWEIPFTQLTLHQAGSSQALPEPA